LALRLYDETKALLAWAAEQRLSFDFTQTSAGAMWGCRLEIYHTDPAVEPDMNKWETDLVFRVAD
jgi:hypothetical protein